MGLGVSIPLPAMLSAAQLFALGGWLRALGPVTPEEKARWEVFVEHLWLLGLGRFAGQTSGAFWVAVEDETDVDTFRDLGSSPHMLLQEAIEEEQRQLTAILGFAVRARIGLRAGCNGPLDHRILGCVALSLADRYGGMIDMHGRIMPRKPVVIDIDAPVLPGGYLPLVSDEQARDYLAGMPGRAVEVAIAAEP